MRDIRLGNDIKVDWYITRKDDQAFSLEGLNVSLYLKSMFGRKPLNDFVITGNIIQWVFFGKDQKSSGKYSLELVVNEGEKGMITTDACDFVNLVSCSCQLSEGENESGVEIESIELESKVDLSSGEAVTIVVDSELSETSVNPVENRVITSELKKKADKTEIPTKLSQLEQDIEIGSEVDLTDYLKGEVVSTNEPTAEFPQVLYVPQSLSEEQKSQARENIGVDAELSKLSSQVSTLSEKIENLPSGESDVFEAIYGTTSYDEIKEAFEANKVVYCSYQTRIYMLSKLETGAAYFAVTHGNYYYRLVCYPGAPSTSWGATSENFQHSLKSLANGNAQITIAGNTAEVATPQYVDNAVAQGGGGQGGNKEWKLVAEQRMQIGDRNIEFTTFAEGTPLLAEEVIVQILLDTKASENRQGYVVIHSSDNATDSMYGAVNYESTNASETVPLFQQFHFKASPYYMAAEIVANANVKVASLAGQQVSMGSVAPPQIYKDITYIKIAPNGAISSTTPLIKIYAR